MEALIQLFVYCASFILLLVTIGFLARFTLIVSGVIRRYRHARILQSYGVSPEVSKIYIEVISESYSRSLAIAERLKSRYNIPPEVIKRVTEF